MALSSRSSRSARSVATSAPCLWRSAAITWPVASIRLASRAARPQQSDHRRSASSRSLGSARSRRQSVLADAVVALVAGAGAPNAPLHPRRRKDRANACQSPIGLADPLHTARGSTSYCLCADSDDDDVLLNRAPDRCRHRGWRRRNRMRIGVFIVDGNRAACSRCLVGHQRPLMVDPPSLARPVPVRRWRAISRPSRMPW